MKKLSRILSLMLLALVILPSMALAQEMPQIPQLGVDPEVRIGKLPNGLTYYIRHNDKPSGQADFYIAQKVGSILEEDNQRGLAHFLEHMCFNGTTHFPGKNLINWLESVGVKFGQNLNAMTGVETTTYLITNVPVDRTGVQDSCLLILHDWANDLLLLPEEIDAERAVIHEEWRRSMVGQMRILEGLLPVIYPDSRYGHRLPIGTMEVVDNFAPQALRDYYEKWYRPDQQGVIVVGDIDVDRIEAKIKEMFSDIEMPQNPAERVYLPVADNEGTIYAIGHDKEQQNAIAEMMIKREVFPDNMKNTQLYLAQKYIDEMVTRMLNTRLEDISSKPNAPFAGASAGNGDFFLSKTKAAFDLSVIAQNGQQLPSALAAAYREVLRALRGGFTQTEYERERAEYLSAYEKAYNSRNDRRNGQFVQEYLGNFLENEPIPTIDEEYQTVKAMAEMIPVEALNQVLPQYITPNNRVVIALMPDTEDGVYPTEEQFASALQAVDGETIEPYKEELKAEPLIENLPAAGKIVKEEKNAQWDATVWTLSNGATVIVKPTSFKENEILFNAVANNGTAQIKGDNYNASLNFMPILLGQGMYGLGNYSNSDLKKYLSGKQAAVSPSFAIYTRSFSGSTTPKDLQTLMELIYMNFGHINFTADEFAAYQSTFVSVLHNQESTPDYIFQKDLLEALYPSNRLRALSSADIEGASREQIVDVCRQMTANAADFTFTFVGNVDLATLRPLVEQYIATIPGNAKTAERAVKPVDPAYDVRPGTATDSFTTAMQTPQSYIYVTSFGNAPFNAKNCFLADAAGQILSKRLIDKIREEMGATYSCGAQGDMSRIGQQNTQIVTSFPMKPEMREAVVTELQNQFNAMASTVKQEELDKVKEYLVKNAKEGKELNSSWLGAISGWTRDGVDIFNGNIDVISSLTVADVQQFVKSILDQNNYRVVLLNPAE